GSPSLRVRAAPGRRTPPARGQRPLRRRHAGAPRQRRPRHHSHDHSLSSPMASIVKFDLPAAAPEIDFPREERREVGVPERRTWVLYESGPAGMVAGIWECEVGRWRIQMDPTEHEYMVVLAGRCRLHATD